MRRKRKIKRKENRRKMELDGKERIPERGSGEQYWRESRWAGEGRVHGMDRVRDRGKRKGRKRWRGNDRER